MNDYVPLLEALKGHFEQSLDALPDALRRPVAELFYPLRWDDCDPGYRRRLVEHSATRPSSEASEEERQFVENLFALEDQCMQEIVDLKTITCSSVSDYELKKSKLADAERKLAQIKLQRCEARGDYLEVEDSAISTSSCQPADSEQIVRNFRVHLNEDQNAAWWESQMRNASRGKFKLADCRVGAGRKGRGAKTLWRPDQIAGWLIDRYERKLDGMSSSAASTALKKFPGCADIADSFSPPEN